MRYKTFVVFIALACFLPTACITIPKAPPAKARMGSARLPQSKRVVVFTPSCKGVEKACSREFVSSLYGRVVSELEFKGYTIVHADELLATLRERTSVDASLGASGVAGSSSVGSHGGSTSISSGILGVGAQGGLNKGGASYSDLTPAQRRDLLAQARVDGTLRMTVLIGDDTNSSFLHDVHLFEVTARLASGEDESPVWTSYCATPAENTKALGGVGRSYAQAGDKLGRCIIAQVER